MYCLSPSQPYCTASGITSPQYHHGRIVCEQCSHNLSNDDGIEGCGILYQLSRLKKEEADERRMNPK
jgi:hypothetical protein